MDELTPKDPAEAIALYRAQIVGPLVRRELERGDLRAALLSVVTLFEGGSITNSAGDIDLPRRCAKPRRTRLGGLLARLGVPYGHPSPEPNEPPFAAHDNGTPRFS
jgi:hypothetical protein